jgi:hypothetical protein
MPDDPVDRDLRDDLDPYREIGRRGEREREHDADHAGRAVSLYSSKKR